MHNVLHNAPESRETTMPSWAHIYALAVRVGAGDRPAWPELMAALEPKLQILVRYQKIGRLRSREDDLRNVVVAVFEKLASRDFAALRRFSEMTGRPSFEAWIRRVMRSVAIDYLRGHAEYRRTGTRSSERGSADRWVSLLTYTTGVGAIAPDSAAQRRREVLAALAETVAVCAGVRAGDAEAETVAAQLGLAPLHVRRIAKRGPRMQDVVSLLFEGYRHGSIADQLGLSRREVELAIKHVEELLVARWGQGQGASDEPAEDPDPDRL